MGQCEKTSTLVYKWCWCCKKQKPISEFYRNSRKQDGVGTECKPCKRACDKQYRNSDLGKLTHRNYTLSDAYKATRQRYEQTWKAKIRKMRYNDSEHGRARNKERKLKHVELGNCKRWACERYYRIQDEMGYHHDPNLFYPGYRFVQALSEAEVVEI